MNSRLIASKKYPILTRLAEFSSFVSAIAFASPLDKSLIARPMGDSKDAWTFNYTA